MGEKLAKLAELQKQLELMKQAVIAAATEAKDELAQLEKERMRLAVEIHKAVSSLKINGKSAVELMQALGAKDCLYTTQADPLAELKGKIAGMKVEGKPVNDVLAGIGATQFTFKAPQPDANNVMTTFSAVQIGAAPKSKSRLPKVSSGVSIDKSPARQYKKPDGTVVGTLKGAFEAVATPDEVKQHAEATTGGSKWGIADRVVKAAVKAGKLLES